MEFFRSFAYIHVKLQILMRRYIQLKSRFVYRNDPEIRLALIRVLLLLSFCPSITVLDILFLNYSTIRIAFDTKTYPGYECWVEIEPTAQAHTANVRTFCGVCKKIFYLFDKACYHLVQIIRCDE